MFREIAVVLYGGEDAISRHRAWMLPLSVLLVAVPLGCEDKPAPVTKPAPVADARKQKFTEPDVKLSPEEKAAIAAIEKLGGKVAYPEVVNFNRAEVTDAHLVHVKGLTSLQSM